MDFRTQKSFGGRVKPGSRSGSACGPWAMLLPDAADGLLNDAEQRALDRHLAGCAACSEELAEAQRGLAWLTMLKDQTPEPPKAMLASILAQTTGYAEAGVSLPPLPHVPALVAAPGPLLAGEANGWANHVSGWRSWLGLGDDGWSALVQPRLAMTGAMAFLSICLTLNLLGVSVDQLSAQSLRSGGLHRTVANTSASLARSIHGLRVVYQVESRVSEMRAQMDDSSASPSGR